MFPKYRTLGLVFKIEEKEEADFLLKVYTQNFGKISILGKGIRKISSKLRPATQLFNLSEIEFVEGKNNKILTDAIIKEKFLNIKKDLKRLAIAYKISESLDELILDEEKEEKVWFLILETFFQLNDQSFSTKNLSFNYYYFFWNLISILGHKPQLYFCAFCQKKLLAKNLYFNEKEGGIICQNCFKKLNYGKKVSSSLVKMLRIILEKKFDYFMKIKASKEEIENLEKISENFFIFLKKKNL